MELITEKEKTFFKLPLQNFNIRVLFLILPLGKSFVNKAQREIVQFPAVHVRSEIIKS